jgi:indole-3-glycerol phosphate synthase
MTVKSKSVVHTKLVVLASIASVLSEKRGFQGRFLCCRGSHIGKNAVLLQNNWLIDFGGFPVTSSSMTVKSKSVVHTKLVMWASIESVLSEKRGFQGHFAVLQRLSHRQKRSFATKQLAE